MDREEIITQAQQIIAEITRTLDTLQAAAETIMDDIATERAALDAAALFCISASPNGEKAVEGVERIVQAFDKIPQSVGAVGFADAGRV